MQTCREFRRRGVFAASAWPMNRQKEGCCCLLRGDNLRPTVSMLITVASHQPCWLRGQSSISLPFPSLCHLTFRLVSLTQSPRHSTTQALIWAFVSGVAAEALKGWPVIIWNKVMYRLASSTTNSLGASGSTCTVAQYLRSHQQEFRKRLVADCGQSAHRPLTCVS